jgi:hypothetical protein
VDVSCGLAGQAYRALTDGILAPTAFVYRDDQSLLTRITWPAGPPGAVGSASARSPW